MHREERTIISYQRDRFVPTKELSLPYWDDVSGTLRGYRVFTACRTLRGKIFRVDDHVGRLYDSADGIHMIPPVSQDELTAPRRGAQAALDVQALRRRLGMAGMAASLNATV